MASNEQRNSGGRLFAIAVALGIIGGGALLGGISLILGRTGNASTHLADVGLLLLIVASAANVVAIAMGLRFMLGQKVLLWWWPISLLLAAAAVAGGVIALTL